MRADDPDPPSGLGANYYCWKAMVCTSSPGPVLSWYRFVLSCFVYFE